VLVRTASLGAVVAFCTRKHREKSEDTLHAKLAGAMTIRTAGGTRLYLQLMPHVTPELRYGANSSLSHIQECLFGTLPLCSRDGRLGC
jgi:hypothetical protein